MTLIVGTRGSRLALTQTNWVIDQLKKAHPSLAVETKIIKTKGDKILDKPLSQIGDKGLFVKEIEQALLNKDIDIAVHSMKDMPSEQPEGLVLVAPPEREDPRDALVLREGLHGLDDVPAGGKLGTGSIRRISQIKKLRPDIDCVSVRGNVETRMKKIESEGLDGVVLAAAGLKRLGLEDCITHYLSPEQMLPAPAQGILAIEVRETDAHTRKLLLSLVDSKTTVATAAERGYLAKADGSCHMPIGALCEQSGDCIVLYGLLGTEDGSTLVMGSKNGQAAQAQQVGEALAMELKQKLRDALMAKAGGQKGTGD